MQLDAMRVAETRAWLVKAAIDITAAEYERTASPPITADMVFHAQQLVEKTLKAFLSWHDQPFRKTHSLVELGRQCSNLAPDLQPLLDRRRLLPSTPGNFDILERQKSRMSQKPMAHSTSQNKFFTQFACSCRNR